MFGWGSEAKIRAAGEDYCRLAFDHSDRVYVKFLEQIVQVLIDAGLDENETQFLVGSDDSKLAFTCGLCAEQLLAARNIYGEKVGIKLEDEAIAWLGRLTDPRARAIFSKTRTLLDHCRVDPLNTRMHILSYMFVVNKMGEHPVLRKFDDSPVMRMMVNSTIMTEGEPQGVVYELSQRHRLT